VTSQDDYVVPQDPPALKIIHDNIDTAIDNDTNDNDDTIELQQLCAQLSKIPSISKVLEEAEAEDPTNQTGLLNAGLLGSFKTQPLRPLRRRRSETKHSGVVRTTSPTIGAALLVPSSIDESLY